jgi:uncharacterized protein YndB with AHSA1/START domain
MTEARSSEVPSLTVVRTFAATPAEVYAAWTDAALIAQWLAPTPCEVVEVTTDARVGGYYRIVVASPTGVRHVTTGEYLELDPARRIVQTWIYTGANFRDPYPTLLTVDLRATGAASTEITLRQDQLITDADRAGNRGGWRLCFDKLDALLARSDARPSA